MNALFLYPVNGEHFDRENIVGFFEKLPEFEMEPDEAALCTGRFEFEGETNLVELKRSLEVIVLGREGKAALKLAFDIQEQYHRPLNLTDESYSFELCVSDFESFRAFEIQAMAELED